MAQIFGRQTNWLARASLIAVPVVAFLTFFAAGAVDRSSYVTREGEYLEQPVPFSHKHHVGELRIDCRYCHSQVEKSAMATLPQAEICMTCHSEIWAQSKVLKPVRESAENNTPIEWTRVTELPDFVYFNHSIHINKGISCISCHGEVGRMPLTKLEHGMTMEFCLNCHRSPEKYLVRPEDRFAGSASDQKSTQELEALQTELAHHYNVRSRVDCITCHR